MTCWPDVCVHSQCVLKTIQREDRFTLNTGHMGLCMFGLTVFYYFVYQGKHKEQCSWPWARFEHLRLPFFD